MDLALRLNGPINVGSDHSFLHCYGHERSVTGVHLKRRSVSTFEGLNIQAIPVPELFHARNQCEVIELHIGSSRNSRMYH